MRRAPQVLTRLGYTSTARLNAQLSCEVRRTTAGGFSVRECNGGQCIDRGALALGSRRWSSSEAVSNEVIQLEDLVRCVQMQLDTCARAKYDTSPLEPPSLESMVQYVRAVTACCRQINDLEGEQEAPTSFICPPLLGHPRYHESCCST